MSDMENRIIRAKMERALVAVDSRIATPGQGNLRFLGTVTTSGSFPTQVPAVFLLLQTHVNIVNTTTGPIPSLVTDLGVIPATCLGPKVPAIGDVVPVYDVGGAWCFERMGTTNPCNAGCLLPTTGVMTFSWSGGTLEAGSQPMVYGTNLLCGTIAEGWQIQGTYDYAPGCWIFDEDGVFDIVLYCSSDQIIAGVCFDDNLMSCGECVCQDGQCAFTLTGFTCNPFSTTWTVPDDPSLCSANIRTILGDSVTFTWTDS